MKTGYLLFFVPLLLSVPGILPAQDVQVSASVSTDTIGVQDQLQYSITVSGKDSGDAETPRVTRFRDFQIVAGPSVSTQFQWINGRTNSTKSFIWVLLPEKEGQITIDPVEVRVGSQAFKTQQLSIRVTPGSSQPSQPRSRTFDPFNDEAIRPRPQISGEEVFVTAEVDRTSPYPGQQVTLSYHLYTQVGVTGVQLKESPPLTGFWVEELEVPPNPTGVRKTVNGREYLDFVIGKRALFPNTPGKLKIPESTFAVSAKSAGDFLGIFGQSETLYRKTRELTLDVKPLPMSDRPAGFGNAVGSFNLTSNLDKSVAATGEAVTLRVKLSGRGNLKMLPDVSLPVLPDFTVYSSKRVDNPRTVEGSLIGGDKTWEYVIVPKAPGDQVIPALSMSYFDPEREKYETVTAQSLSLKVTRGEDGGGAIGSLSGFTKQNLTRQGSDINFIKLSAGDLDRGGDPIYRSPWLYLLALAPLVFNLGLLIYQRETARQSENVVLVRSRKARRTALARLRKAEKGNKEEARRFYDEAAVALSGYLADRFNLPEIALTGDSLERTLSEKSVPPATLNAIQACLQECDFGRFVSAAPGKTGVLASRIRKVIDSLEQV